MPSQRSQTNWPDGWRRDSEAIILRALDIGHDVKKEHFPEHLNLKSGDSAGFDPFLRRGYVFTGFGDSESAPELYAETKSGPAAVESLGHEGISELLPNWLGKSQLCQMRKFMLAATGSVIMMYNNKRGVYVLGEFSSGVKWMSVGKAGLPPWLWDLPGVEQPMRKVRWRLCGDFEPLKKHRRGAPSPSDRLGFTFRESTVVEISGNGNGRHWKHPPTLPGRGVVPLLEALVHFARPLPQDKQLLSLDGLSTYLASASAPVVPESPMIIRIPRADQVGYRGGTTAAAHENQRLGTPTATTSAEVGEDTISPEPLAPLIADRSGRSSRGADERANRPTGRPRKQTKNDQQHPTANQGHAGIPSSSSQDSALAQHPSKRARLEVLAAIEPLSSTADERANRPTGRPRKQTKNDQKHPTANQSHAGIPSSSSQDSALAQHPSERARLEVQAAIEPLSSTADERANRPRGRPHKQMENNQQQPSANPLSRVDVPFSSSQDSGFATTPKMISLEDPAVDIRIQQLELQLEEEKSRRRAETRHRKAEKSRRKAETSRRKAAEERLCSFEKQNQAVDDYRSQCKICHAAAVDLRLRCGHTICSGCFDTMATRAMEARAEGHALTRAQRRVPPSREDCTIQCSFCRMSFPAIIEDDLGRDETCRHGAQKLFFQ